MKRKLTLLLALIISATSLCACGNPEEVSDKENLSNDYTRSTAPEESFNYADGMTTPPSAYNTYSSLITNFELRLFRQYSSNNSDSFVFSPSSTALQLGLLLNGSSGETRDEISRALGNDLTAENINQCSAYFKSRMEAVSKLTGDEVDELSGKKIEPSYTEFVSLDNSLFVNDTFDVKSGFLQTNASFFENDIFRLMFSQEDTLKKINSHLGGEALKAIDGKQSMISVTSSEISDRWLESYSQEDMEKAVFHSASGDRELSFMTSNEQYISSDSAQGIIKYTDKNPLKLILIMPDEDVDFAEYMSDFTYLEYTTLLESMDITKLATAKIPELELAGGKEAKPMSKTVAESGLHSLFTDKAEFSGISNAENFMLNEMYEITPSLSLTANGINTEKTVIAEKRAKELVKTDVTVEFNRPFIFLLIDNESNIPIYMGSYVK